MHSPTPRQDQKLRDIITRSTHILEKANVDSPRLSAEVLIAFILKKDRNKFLKTLIITPDMTLAEEEVSLIKDVVKRRAQGEPVAYITGEKEFYGRLFKVSNATLIPRPETELLIDEAIFFASDWQQKHKPPYTFADLGTGTGCIGITIAKELPTWQGILVDKSEKALCIAEKNAKLLETQNIRIQLADFCTFSLNKQSLDMVVTNPPYIGEADYTQLSKEVRNFEPKTALVPKVLSQKSPSQGLEYASILVELAARTLKPNGLFLMEIGYDQKEEIMALCSQRLWESFEVKNDLAGLPRYVKAIRL